MATFIRERMRFIPFLLVTQGDTQGNSAVLVMLAERVAYIVYVLHTRQCSIVDKECKGRWARPRLDSVVDFELLAFF